MKLFILLLSCVITMQLSAQDKYSLTGNIQGCNAAFAYISHAENDQHPMDSTAISGGKFQFSGTVSKPELCMLLVNAPNGQKKALYFYLQPGAITINGHIDSMGRSQITGSSPTDEFRALSRQIQPYTLQLNKLGPVYEDIEKKGTKAQLDSISKLYDDVKKEKWTVIEKYVTEHPDAYAGAFYAASAMESVGDAEAVYPKMTSPVRQSYSGMKIKALLDAAQQTAVGSIAPDFKLKDLNGKSVSLQSMRGKYILIDFWASWCKPCRAESPNLVAAYQKNKQKDFTIVGISIDTDKENWKTAVKNDHMAWAQLIDDGEWNSDIVKKYAVKTIPLNFLLDKQGKIIAKNLRGDDLPEKIASLIK